MPKRHCFGIREQSRKDEAERLYHDWVGKHLNGETPEPVKGERKVVGRLMPTAEVHSGSIIEITSGLIESERHESVK